jgi:translation initiation factor IF-2
VDAPAFRGSVFGSSTSVGSSATRTPKFGRALFSKPAFGVNKDVALTAEERRQADLVSLAAIKMTQRPVKIYSGLGPQSTRAGRLDPALQAEKLVAAAESAKGKAMDLNQRRIADDRPLVSKQMFGQVSESSNTSRDITGNSRDGGESRGWNQLRTRRPAITSAGDKFTQGREQRETQSRQRSYTPLTANISVLRASTERQGQSTVTWRPTLETTKAVAMPWNPMDFAKSSSRIPGRRNNFGETAEIPKQTFLKDAKEVNEEFAETEQNQHKRQTINAQKFTTVDAPRQSWRLDDIPKGKGRDRERRRQRFTNDEDGEEEHDNGAKARAEVKRQRKRDKAAKKAAAPSPILLPEYISVSNLAAALRVRVEDFVNKMEELGFVETGYDHILNGEDAGLIAMEYNFDPIIDRGVSEDLKARPAPEDVSLLPPKAPVVTIMGHVDHGKTTLLDYLRKSSVAATEHGGITQHIGAFSVPMPSGKVITFLDTPGHAAFLSMRQRGANVTDIVILVVAADDSVKPQTIEAINHAKAAKVPIIVAINKIDKQDSNIERVKQDLARHGVDVEDFGGDTQVVCVSGKTGKGIPELEEAVATLSEILDMRADTEGQAEGWILEASIKPMGKVATVLVRQGTMRRGDFIVAGKTWARIRCLRNEAGVEIDQAGPGTPVEIDGWKDQPLAGDEVLQAPNESKAKSVIDYRLEKEERDKMAEDMEAINEARKNEQDKRAQEKMNTETRNDAENAAADMHTLSNPDGQTGAKKVYFIIKGDVSGSVEAVVDSILALGTKEVQPHIIRSGVGQLAEFDVEHCAAAKGYLINFNTSVDPNILGLAEKTKVDILDHNIIYRLVDDVKAKLSEYLPPLITHRVLGEAEIAQIFEITVKGRQQKAIAGCKVRNGTVEKNRQVRVLRMGEKIYDGKSQLSNHCHYS